MKKYTLSYLSQIFVKNTQNILILVFIILFGGVCFWLGTLIANGDTEVMPKEDHKILEESLSNVRIDTMDQNYVCDRRVDLQLSNDWQMSVICQNDYSPLSYTIAYPDNWRLEGAVFMKANSNIEKVGEIVKAPQLGSCPTVRKNSLENESDYIFYGIDVYTVEPVSLADKKGTLAVEGLWTENHGPSGSHYRYVYSYCLESDGKFIMLDLYDNDANSVEDTDGEIFQKIIKNLNF